MTKYTVTFTAGKTSRGFDMFGTKAGCTRWAKRERHYFAPGIVARYAVRRAEPAGAAEVR